MFQTISLNLKRIGLWAWSLGAGVYLALNFSKFWTDSEMWSSVVVKYLFSGHPGYYFPLKPIMNFVLWLIFKWSVALEQHPMLIARLVWGVGALTVMILVDQILRKKRISHFSRVLCQLCFFSVSTWVFRSGEVRSDALALLFLLGGYLLSLRFNEIGKKLFALCLGCVFAILSTPKVLLFMVVLSPLLLEPLKEIVVYKKKLLAGVVALFLMIFLTIFHEPLFQAFTFFSYQFSVKEGGIPYFSLMRFEHIFRMLLQNIHFDLLILVALFIGFKKGLFREALSLSLILILIVFYPDPLPFFLSALIPWIFICTFSILDSYFSRLNDEYKRQIGALAVVIAVSLFSWRGSQMFKNSNHNQRKVAEWANQEFLGEDLLIYDPTGILWLPKVEHWFLGPGMADELPRAMKDIEERKPDVILYTNKANYLNFRLPSFLLENYYSPAPTIWTLKPYEFKSPPPIDNFIDLFRYDTTF